MIKDGSCYPPRQGASRFALPVESAGDTPESSEHVQSGESTTVSVKVRQYLNHRIRNPWEHALVVNAGRERCVSFTLPQSPMYCADAEFLLEVKIKFTIVPSLRQQA